MRCLAAAALLLCAASALGTTVVAPLDAPRENPHYDSPNGRFRVVVEIRQEDEPPATYTAVLYETAFGWPVERARFEIPAAYDRILVPDSGRFFVTFEQPLLAIYRDDGVARKVALADVFTPSDAEALSWQRVGADYRLEDDRIAVTLPRTIKGGSDRDDYESIHIDLDGRLVEEKHDIYPPHRVWAVAAGAVPAAWPDCAERSFARVPTEQLLARARKPVMPEFPVVAKKARIFGLVIADVVVSAAGDVVCSRISKPLPFGMDQAVMRAIANWKFEPGAGPVAGSIGFRFGQPEHAEWRELSAPR